MSNRFDIRTNQFLMKIIADASVNQEARCLATAEVRAEERGSNYVIRDNQGRLIEVVESTNWRNIERLKYLLKDKCREESYSVPENKDKLLNELQTICDQKVDAYEAKSPIAHKVCYRAIADHLFKETSLFSAFDGRPDSKVMIQNHPKKID